MMPHVPQVGERFAWLLLPVILVVSTLLSSPLLFSAKLETVQSILASAVNRIWTLYTVHLKKTDGFGTFKNMTLGRVAG
jgi:hypothetical protein